MAVLHVVAVVPTTADLAVHPCTAVAEEDMGAVVECMEVHLAEEGM